MPRRSRRGVRPAPPSDRRPPLLADALPGGRVRDVVLTIGFAASVAGAGRGAVEVRGSPVPISAQSLVALSGSIALGPARATAGAGLYGVLGAAGVDGFAPANRFTRGYVAGLLVVGPVLAWQAGRGRARTARQVAVATALGHAAILAAGAAWLKHAGELDASRTWRRGVRPFLLGAIVKSGVATASVSLAWRLVDAVHRRSAAGGAP